MSEASKSPKPNNDTPANPTESRSKKKPALALDTPKSPRGPGSKVMLTSAGSESTNPPATPRSSKAGRLNPDSLRHRFSGLLSSSTPETPKSHKAKKEPSSTFGPSNATSLVDPVNKGSTTDVVEPTYHTSVEMSGWVLKHKARIRTNQVRRYFRLNNSILSNHPQLTGPSTWDASVSKCIVRTVDTKCIVIIRLPGKKEIRFQLTTVAEMERWATAIRSASVCNIEDFYRLGDQLGFGSFGAVRLGFDLATGAKRAVKIVERTSNAKELEFVQREMNVLLSISHPNIVRTYDIFDERNKIYFVMDYVQGGDFFDYMSKKGKLDEAPTKHVMWQMLQGISYLHENHIVHRDIKPENVLVVSTSPLTIQLTDFGFANFIDPASAAPATDMKSMVGTGCYMAPEVADSRGHGKPVDIFATGVVLFRVLSGKLPFRGMTLVECYKQAMMEKADLNGKEWKKISSAGRELCRAMLSADPDKRPTVTEAIAHEWFTSDEQFMAEIEALDAKVDKKEGVVSSLRKLISPENESQDSSQFEDGSKTPRSLPPMSPRYVNSRHGVL